MERCKTGSMTHLTKILIAEELDKVIPDIQQRLKKLEVVEDELENAGEVWSLSEDRKLEIELEDLVSTIARRHKRSLNAIRARLKMVLYQQQGR